MSIIKAALCKKLYVVHTNCTIFFISFIIEIKLYFLRVAWPRGQDNYCYHIRHNTNMPYSYSCHTLQMSEHYSAKMQYRIRDKTPMIHKQEQVPETISVEN